MAEEHPPSTPSDDAVILLEPRPGHLTPAWRLVVAVTWIGVVLALAGVWNASTQLGLSTWWLGPRGDPQPRLVQLSPFLAPLAMVLGTVYQVRWLGRLGLVASAVVAGFGVGDLGRVDSIAVTELVIAGAAAVVSVASLTGTFRAPDTPDR